MPVWVLALIHLELPVVLLGFGWMLLGYVLWLVGRDLVRPQAGEVMVEPENSESTASWIRWSKLAAMLGGAVVTVLIRKDKG